jgi:multidrug efflux pump subunit AcrB
MGYFDYFCGNRRYFILGKFTMKKGFVPTEDRGIIFTDVQLPPGASMERTYNALKTLQAKL